MSHGLRRKFRGFKVNEEENCNIVMGRDNVHAQRIIIGDIHPTGGIIEEAVMFLADSFLLA